jgi:heterodisulfide reductase subunit A2
MASEPKDTKNNGEPTVGVYICHCGGNISDHVDVEALEAFAETLPGVTVARRNMFMCSDPGQDLIMGDIEDGTIERVVVASCAPSLHETTFRGATFRAGLNPYLYEHANIREQVSWVHHGDGATNKAKALVAAAVSKTKLLDPLKAIKVDAVAHATVIGGGIAGLKSARDIAARGLKVTLVEKTPFLGGNTAQLDRVFPTGEKAGDLIAKLAAEVMANPNIEILTCAEVTEFQGYVGNFHLKIARRPVRSSEDAEKLARFKTAGVVGAAFVPFIGILPMGVPKGEPGEVVERDLETGAVIMATGFNHYTPKRDEYGYGTFPEVITLPDLIKVMATTEGDALVVNGHPVNSMAMVHCVGSRHIPGISEPGGNGVLNEYCSRVCCTATLQAALEVKERFPETVIYDLYRDIRTYGRGHEEYYVNASRQGVLFVRFEPQDPPVISKADPGDEAVLKVAVKDTLLAGRELEIPVDLVVLSVGMETADISALTDRMKIATGTDRFLLEVHPKLRPVELAAGGMFLAGTCQAPMDISEAAAAASAAAVKTSSILSRGHVELAPFVAQVNQDKCIGSGCCIGACAKEGAISLVDVVIGGRKVKRAQVNPALCQGAGTCVPVCPQGAIDLAGWTVPQYEAMVDAIVAHGVAGGAD